jgi:2',3'-cyclic-nucleotide 2'-phosphodiesterase / 3'-nucleotidase
MLGMTRLTVMGTTDLHGNVLNHDYFRDSEYDDPWHNDVGLAKVATLVEQVRAGREHTLLVDAGDTIQGTPLAYYYATIDRERRHPVAAAMNAIGYDAAAVGNHEFNYGLEVLRDFERQCDFPLLAANALDARSGEPVFPPYVLKRVGPIAVGILGLTNPGVAIWDRGHVEGRLRFGGIVEQARVWVPRLRALGADVVVVLSHSGVGLSSSYGDLLEFPENCSALLAEQVPGIDLVLVGHAHALIAEQFVTNAATGEQVLLTEPSCWGMRLAVADLELERDGDRWRVTGRSATLLNANTVAESSAIAELVRDDHASVVTYVNSRIGRCTAEMSAAEAGWRDTPALALVHHVQGAAVSEGLAGTAYQGLPVVSMVAPFNRRAGVPAGDVSIRDVAALYPYDNTLVAVELTGAQLGEYLEYAARFYRPATGVERPEDLVNAPAGNAPRGLPDYSYDAARGFTAPLRYDIDLARPVGDRIQRLSYDGGPVAPDQRFVVALNNYRSSGGGGYPHLRTAPVVHDRQQEIRQLVIDHVRAAGELDPASFGPPTWRLVVDGRALRDGRRPSGGR